MNQICCTEIHLHNKNIETKFYRFGVLEINPQYHICSMDH